MVNRRLTAYFFGGVNFVINQRFLGSGCHGQREMFCGVFMFQGVINMDKEGVADVLILGIELE